MFKNVAGQSIELFAFDKTTNSPKTGDAGNITTYIGINYGGMAASGNTVTEWNSIKAPGWYILALAQAETNGDALMFTGTSSTANILLVGRPITTLPANFSTLAVSGGGAVTVGTNNDKTGYGLSAAAVQAIWDALTSALTTAGSIGKLLVDNINATISSRSTYAGGAVSSVTAPVTAGTVTDKTGYSMAAAGLDLVVMSDLAGPPTATAKIASAISWLFMAVQNDRKTTSTQDKISNNAGAAVGTATISDDGTTYEKTAYT